MNANETYRETETMLTDKEFKLLNGILTCDFASDNGDGTDNANYPVWTWDALETSELPVSSLGGVASSLEKKGLASFETSGKKDDRCCYATQAGVDAWIAAKGEEPEYTDAEITHLEKCEAEDPGGYDESDNPSNGWRSPNEDAEE